MGTISYSGELLCRQWDNSEVDSRGVLGAFEWFAHHLTCMGTQNNNSNDGEHCGQKSIYPIYVREWTPYLLPGVGVRLPGLGVKYGDIWVCRPRRRRAAT